MELTKGDISTLIEAIDAWASMDHKNGLMSAMIGGLLIRDDNAREEMMDERLKNADFKAKEKDEIATILKAKLILMKNNLVEPANALERSPKAAHVQ